jgi:hypothetical protein
MQMKKMCQDCKNYHASKVDPSVGECIPRLPAWWNYEKNGSVSLVRFAVDMIADRCDCFQAIEEKASEK